MPTPKKQDASKGSKTSSSSAGSSAGTAGKARSGNQGARQRQAEGVKTDPAFWELEGYRLAAKRFDSLAFLLEQSQRMMRDRASLAKKHANDLHKFSNKWKSKFKQANIFSNGQFFNSVMASCDEPEVTAHALQLLADKITNGPLQQARAEQTKHYERSFGRLKATSAALQEFRSCESTYSKAVKASAKHRKTYYSKQDAVLKLEEHKAQAGTIVSDTIDDERRKLEAKLETAKKEAIKAAQKYKEAVAAANKEFNTYAQSMRQVYDSQDATIHTRLKELLSIFHNYTKTLDLHQTSYKQDLQDLLRKFTTVDLRGDLSSYRQAMGVDQAPPQLSFHEAPSMKSAGVVTTAVMTMLQSTQKKEKKPAVWFVKSGEGSHSRSHKRYFVLNGTDLVYYSSANLGVPGNRKGIINLPTARQIYVADNATLIIDTPGRLWKLHSKRPQLLAEWRDLLCERVGLPKGATQASASPGVPAAAAVATGAAVGAASAANANNNNQNSSRSGGNVNDSAASTAGRGSEPTLAASTQPTPTPAATTAATAATTASTGGALAATSAMSQPSANSNSLDLEDEEESEQVRAATTIQAYYRGHRTRKQLKKRDNAARVIQQHWKQSRSS